MTIYYHAADRKALVKAISEITGVKPKYLGMPSTAYEIDYFTVDRDGNLNFDDMADSEDVENLIERLNNMGFIAEEQNTEQPESNAETAETENQAEEEAEELSDKTDKAETKAITNLTVSLPIENVSIENLKKLLEAKGILIKKALGVSDLQIEVGDDTVTFPWFTNPIDADTANVYTGFVAAICKMTKEQKRITAKEKAADNEKYAFRCFLLRLGYIGDEFKAARKILLKNLSGSSAFKNGKKVA